MRQRTIPLLVMGAALSFVAVPAAVAEVLPEPVPVPSLPAIEDPNAASARLVPVPAGCAAPAIEQVVFIGTMVLNDATTARFAIDSVRSGSTTGFAVGGLIDVRYGDEIRFLERDATYIVGAAIDPEVGVLASAVREPAPLFGGNEIAGVDDSDVDCPQVEDPVRTLRADATSVESGVLSPLKVAKGDLLRAILAPLGVALAILLGLVIVKHLMFALGRSIRDLGSQEPPERRRRHRPADTVGDVSG